MSLRTLLIIGLAMTCGGSAAVGVNKLRREDRSSPAEVVSVVVAAAPVSRGGVIRPESVKTFEWPKKRVPPGVLLSVDDAVGRYATAPLAVGEPVLDAKLADEAGDAGLASMVPPGMRAFTIEASHLATGVGGFVLPGDRVDVLLTTISLGRDDGTGGGATTTLLQNVPVMAVDQRLDAPEENKIDPKELRSVTLLVSPDQAAKLDLGMSRGTLHLTLRNPEDDREARTYPATMAELRFHQEKPLRGLFGPEGLLSRMLTRLPAPEPEPEPEPEAEEVTETEKAEEEGPAYQFVQIRTLRGSHRSAVQVQLPQ